MNKLKVYPILDDNIKVMNLDNCYIHATGGYRGIYNDQNKIIDILADGKIKINEITKNYDSSPLGKVCLCDVRRLILRPKRVYTSSFYNFVCCSPALIFNRDLDVSIPQYVKLPIEIEKDKENMSDMYDEVRYTGDLSLEKLKFITFPIWTENEIEKLHLDIYRVTSSLHIFKNTFKYVMQNYTNISMKNLFTGEELKEEHFDKIKTFAKK